MNRLSDRLGGDLNGAVLSALRNFANNYRYHCPTLKQKEEMDYHANGFIKQMSDNEGERRLYKIKYRELTGRKRKRKHDTTVFLTPVN